MPRIGAVCKPGNDQAEFSIFDMDHNNYLDSKEMKNLNRVLGTDYYDADGDGKFTLDEYKAEHAEEWRLMQEEKIAEQAQKEFNYFDTNKDGRLSSHELTILNAGLGMNIDDHNGGLDVGEYKKAGGGTSAKGDSFCNVVDDSWVTSNPISNTEANHAQADAEFKLFDADENGQLNANEMMVLNRSLGTNVVARFHDTNNDGLLSMDEYRKVGGLSNKGRMNGEYPAAPGALDMVFSIMSGALNKLLLGWGGSSWTGTDVDFDVDIDIGF